MAKTRRDYPEWLIILSGRIVAAVRSGEWGRPEVAEIILKSRNDAAVAKNEKLREALRRAHCCATLRRDGTCDGCFVSAVSMFVLKENGHDRDEKL